MKKTIILFTWTLFSLAVSAQLPDTDIFLSEMSVEKGKPKFSVPLNITHRTGYDNQPAFSPDGKSLLYVSVIDTTQSDIYKYMIESGKTSQVTHSKESEYSPTYSADGKKFSMVRVDRDSGQRFYEAALDDVKHPVVVPSTDSVGYFCRLNDSLLAMFVVGETSTLQLLNTKTNTRKTICRNPGRCIKLTPDKKNMLYILKLGDGDWTIYKYDLATSQSSKWIACLKDNEDFAVMSNGSLLMGATGKLYQSDPEKGLDWQEIADFSATIKSFYRIALSPAGDRIAFVSFTGKKP